MPLLLVVEILGESHQLCEQLLDAQRAAVMRLDHLLEPVEEIVAACVQADQIVQFALDQGPQLLRFDILVRRLLEFPLQHLELDLAQVDRFRRRSRFFPRHGHNRVIQPARDRGHHFRDIRRVLVGAHRFR